MASVNAVIRVNIDASAANAGLQQMAAQMSRFNKGMVQGSASMAAAQVAAANRAQGALNRTGQWMASTGSVMTAAGRMHKQFDKGTMASWQQWRDTSKKNNLVNQMAAQRVRALQTQYVALGREVDGAQRVMKAQPTGMLRQWGAEAEFAHQKAVLLNRRMTMGANSMINWGKNTQWAGRQMMVGMGIPLGIAAMGAVKSYKEMETAAISFKRVYGDATTSAGEKAKMLGVIQNGVGQEMTKYGIAVADTVGIAAKAAATGQQGDKLVTATRETMRLATLGQMDYDTALQSTIATQTAFGVSQKGMVRTTDFLNAAENQTVLSMEDMAKAIPRVAPVIKGLGGDVEDLAVLMTALRAGGVTAEQGANALKSGLGSLINPTSGATEAMEKFGIPLDKIVKTNKGDLIGTVQDFGKALHELPKFEQQQALEALFGKYQYARMGALFNNINKDQARETARLSKDSSANLAKISEQEMSQISDSAMNKFQGAVERLKAAAAPLGEQILGGLAPLVDGLSNVVGFFANNDAARNVALFAGAFAGLAGVGVMLTGVFANFFGTMMKGYMGLKNIGRRMMGRPSLAYNGLDELEASAAQRQLAAAAEGATASLYGEKGAVNQLTAALNAMNAELRESVGLQAAAAGGVVGKGTGRRGTTGSSTGSAGVVPPGAAALPVAGSRRAFQRAHALPVSEAEAARARAFYTNAANRPALTKVDGTPREVGGKKRALTPAESFDRIASTIQATPTDAALKNILKNSAVVAHGSQINMDMEKGQRDSSGRPMGAARKSDISADIRSRGGSLWSPMANMLGIDQDDPKMRDAAQRAAADYDSRIRALPGEVIPNDAIGKAAMGAFKDHFVGEGKPVSQADYDNLMRATHIDTDGTRAVLGALKDADGNKNNYKTTGGSNESLIGRGFGTLPALDDAQQAHTSATKEATKETQRSADQTKKAASAQAKADQTHKAAKTRLAKVEEARAKYAKSAFVNEQDRQNAMKGAGLKTTGTRAGDLKKLDDAIVRAKKSEVVAYEKTAEGQKAVAARKQSEASQAKLNNRLNTRLARQEGLAGAAKGFSGRKFAAGLVGGPQTSGSRGGIWQSMRAGGAFTGETANAWSNKLMGLGMAADMVTMGLMAAGKDVPAWSHMVGMGMMTMGMFPGMIAKPAGMLSAGMKAATAGITSRIVPAVKSFGTGALLAGTMATEMMGLGKKGEIGAGLSRFAGALGIAGIAVAAVGGTALFLNDSMDKQIEAAKVSIQSQATSASAMTAFAQETNQESESMKAQRQVISESIGQTVTQTEQAEVNQKLAGQAGQLMVEQINAAKSTGGVVAGSNSVIAQAAGLWGEGLTGKKETLQIAAQLTSMTGMEGQTVDVVAQVKEIVTSGKMSPIEVQAKISDIVMSPESLGGNAFGSAIDAPWFSQAWADLTAQGTGSWATVVSGGALGRDSMNGEEVLAARNAGAGAAGYMQQEGTVFSVADAYAKFSQAFANNKEMFDTAGAEMSRQINTAFERTGLAGRNSSLNEQVKAAESNAEGAQLRGMMQIKASFASGKMDETFLNDLFSGDADTDLKVATKFDGMSGTDVAILEGISKEKNAAGTGLSANARNLSSALKNPSADPNVITDNMSAYDKLPDQARKSVVVDFATSGSVDQVAGAVKQIDQLPPSIQKKVMVQVSGQEQADQLKTTMDTVNNFKAKDIKLAMDTAGLKDGINDLEDAKRLADELKSGGYAKKTSPTQSDGASVKPAPAAKIKPQKVPTTYEKPKNEGVLKPKGKPTEIKTKYGKPSNQAALKPKGKATEIKTKYAKPSNQGVLKPKGKATVIKTRYAKPGNRGALKPKPQSVKVTYKAGKLPPIEKAQTVKINYEAGALPKPNYGGGEVEIPTSPLPLPQASYGGGDVMIPTSPMPVPQATYGGGEIMIPTSPQPVFSTPAYLGGPIIVPVVTKKAAGGYVFGLANGGEPTTRGTFTGRRVSGPGGPTDDKVPAWLSPGEFVMRQKAVGKYGTDFMHDVNALRLKDGGDGKSSSKGGGKEDSKKKGSDDSGGKEDKDTGWKDWTKEVKKLSKSWDKASKLAVKMKVSNPLLASLFGTGSPNAIGKFNPKKSKQIKKQFKKKQLMESLQATFDTLSENEKMAKAAQARVKLLKKHKGLSEDINRLEADELLAIKKSKNSKAVLKKVMKARNAASDAMFAQEWQSFADESTQSQALNAKRVELANSQKNPEYKKLMLQLTDEEVKQYNATKPGKREQFLIRRRKAMLAQEAFEKEVAKEERLSDLRGQKDFSNRFSNKEFQSLAIESPAAAAGMTEEDYEILQSLSGNELEKFRKALIEAADAANKTSRATELLNKKAEYAAMTLGQQFQEGTELLNQKSQAMRDEQAAIGEQKIVEATGKTRNQLEAEIGTRGVEVSRFQHQQELEQRHMDDINEKYNEQAKLLDDISQAQQIISSLQRGRLSVASALSSGDIAAAAAAAQEQRASEAQASIDMMKSALEKERDDRLKEHQDRIDEAQDSIDTLNDQIFEYQHAMDSIAATYALIGADTSVNIDKLNTSLQAQSGYWAAVVKDIDEYINALKEINPNVLELPEPSQTTPTTTGDSSDSDDDNNSTSPAPLTPRQKKAVKIADRVEKKAMKAMDKAQDAKKAAKKTKTKKDDRQAKKATNKAEKIEGLADKADKVALTGNVDKVKKLNKNAGQKLENVNKKVDSVNVVAAKANSKDANKKVDSLQDKLKAAKEEDDKKKSKALAEKLQKAKDDAEKAENAKQQAQAAAKKKADDDEKARQKKKKDDEDNRKKQSQEAEKQRKKKEEDNKKAQAQNKNKKNNGGFITKKYASGGFVGGIGNTDKVPALLTPGEFVMTKGSAARYGKALERVNSPSYKFASNAAGYSGGSAMGTSIYNLTVNAQTNADANDIATITIKRIQDMERTRIRERKV
jgi:hypothetical protein